MYHNKGTMLYVAVTYIYLSTFNSDAENPAVLKYQI